MLQTLTRVRVLSQRCIVYQFLSTNVRHVCGYMPGYMRRPHDALLEQKISNDQGSSLTMEKATCNSLSQRMLSRPLLRPTLLHRVKTKTDALLKTQATAHTSRVKGLAWLDILKNGCSILPGSQAIKIVEDVLDYDISYDIFQSNSSNVNCSGILKKRKRKMNKHKYKKRRKRDKFKRRNLENIKERKQKAREKADERAKQAAG